MKKLSHKLKILTLKKYIALDLDLKYSYGFGNNLWRNGTNIITSSPRQNSYWCESSEDSLDGVFTAKILVTRLNRKSDWSCNVGIIRSTSNNQASYY